MWPLLLSLFLGVSSPPPALQCPEGAQVVSVGFERYCVRPDGVRHGDYLRFVPGRPARPVEAGQYHQGQKVGAWRRWHDDGRSASEAVFVGGRREGPWRLWHRNGQLAEVGAFYQDQRHGGWTFYDERGRKTAAGSFSQGQEDGRWTRFTDSGAVEAEELYERGRLLQHELKAPLSWFPLQGSARGEVMAGSDWVLGGSGSLLWTWGAPPHEGQRRVGGRFFGLGVSGGLGVGTRAECSALPLCAVRWWGGPAVRVGYGWGDYARTTRRLWPSLQTYVQLTPLAGQEYFPTEPLGLEVRSWLFGARLELGLTSPGWSMAVADWATHRADGGAGSLLAVAALPLALFNHLGFLVQIEGRGRLPDRLMLGLCAGGGF